MKHKAHSFLVLMLLISFSSSIIAQDTIARDPGDFTALNVTGKIRVELYKSDKPLIKILAEGTSSENILTEIKGNTLSIRLKTGTEVGAGIKFLVYYDKLESIKAEAQCLITSPETLTAKTMSFEAKTGGKMELTVALDYLNALVKQGSILVFRGVVEKQDINVNTGATYSAYELDAQDTNVKALSGGKAKVTANRLIDATANLGGFVGYKGEPESRFINAKLGGEIENVED
jgi:hypothetical protein